MNRAQTNFGMHRQQRGVTLVELMIAMLLGVVLVALSVQYVIDGVRGSFLL